MKKVSVIIPVYNTELYLRKCLDSVVNQTLKDIEILVINDGTKDNSQVIIDEYVKKYHNITSYKKDNGGLSSARNYGLKKATGEYISFIDSDDFIDHEMLAKMYQQAKINNDDIVVCNSIDIYDNNTQIEKKSNLQYSDDIISNYLISPPMACTRLYKKAVFNNILFKEGIYYEDLYLTPKLVKYTTKISFIDEGLYYYYQRTGSIMNQPVFNEKLLDIFLVLESNKKELVKKYPQEIEYMYITHLLRTASLRLLDYSEGIKYIDKIISIIKTEFPHYKDNVYYQKSSLKLKIICYLAYHHHLNILKIIKKITKK